MKSLFLHINFVLCSLLCFCQKRSDPVNITSGRHDIDVINKPVIDTGTLSSWTSVEGAAISNNGKFALYKIDNKPKGSSTLVIKSVAGDWKMELPNVTVGFFTQDSRIAVFLKGDDSLCILKLGQSSSKYITKVHSFKIFEHPSKGGFLLIKLDTPDKGLVLYNIGTDSLKVYKGVVNTWMGNNDCTILLQTVSVTYGKEVQFLNLISLTTEDMLPIWEGANVSSLFFAPDKMQIAFVAEQKIGDSLGKSVWYFKEGMEKAVMLIYANSVGINSGLTIEDINYMGFSKNGKSIFVNLKEKKQHQPNNESVKVDIWSYSDAKLQPQQLKEVSVSNKYVSVVDIQNKHVIRLQQENESIKFYKSEVGEIALLTKCIGDFYESNWNPASKAVYYLTSTIDGTRKEVNKYVESVSPGEKYAICKDGDKDYYSYEFSTGIMRNVTKNMPIPMWDAEYDVPGQKPRGMHFVCWMQDTAMIIYDKYDIWRVDPKGLMLPICITNGYGRKNNLVFRLGNEDFDKSLLKNKELLLSVFNRSNKNNGFYSISLNKRANPELLTIGPWLSYHPLLGGEHPIRAKHAEIYIVERQSASLSPNYFLTSDFKEFTRLSDVHPEANYNWLRSQLILFKGLNGQNISAVLYKPENFDSTKKYPVIIHYYEKMSDLINIYRKPEACNASINIPWYVSNGYIVITPDIHYVIGLPGKSAYNSVVGLTKYLRKFHWIDLTKIGIQGHSFGAYETNYIVTHSNLFAAACTAAGPCNLISFYGSLRDIYSGFSLQGYHEAGQGRMGASPWQRQDLYLKSSPILNVNRISTPILMMYNKLDPSNFVQGVELFTALRRLKKKVWMLQYDGEKHFIIGREASLDYTIRMTQFFDYYLKGKQAPKWMISGIPASMKGIDRGLEIDTTWKQP